MAFSLQYKNSAFPFKGSPVKQVSPVDNFLSRYMSGTKVGIGHKPGEKHPKLETSIAGTYAFGPKRPWNLHGGSVGVKYETSSSDAFREDDGPIGGRYTEENPKITDLESRIGGAGGVYFGSPSAGRRESDARFLGSATGDVTYGLAGKSKGEIGYSGRIGLGVGRKGTAGCYGNFCSSDDIIGRGIEAFGEYGSKHSANPGARVGLAGRYGWLSGSASYGVQTKKPQFNIGLKVPLNR